MTDAQTLPPPKPNSTKPKKTKQGKAPVVWPFALLVIFVFTLSALASVYFWQQLEKQNALIDMLTKDRAAAQSRTIQLEQGLNRRINSIEGAFETQTSVFNKFKQQSQFNTQQLHDLGARSRADWLMAETEYLMHLANQRLTLEHDVRGAEAILVSADKVLAENNDPGLLMVRQALGNEILALQQTKTVDSDGLYVRLSAMIKSLDRLNAQAFLSQQIEQKQVESKLVTEQENPEQLYTWKEILKGMWADVQKVIVITPLDQPIKPLLTPDQSYYLKQNLRLMLEQASLALLEKEQVIFFDSLAKASQWMGEYFDITDVQAQVLMSNLNEMKSMKINPVIPDISNSLRLLKGKIEKMYQNHSLGKLSSPSEEIEDNEK